VAVGSDSPTAIQRVAHLELWAGQRLVMWIIRRVQALLPDRMATMLHRATEHSGIAGNMEADSQVNLAHDAQGGTVQELPCTSAPNSDRGISGPWSAAKANWEAVKCSTHFSYRLKDKMGTKRPVPMTRVKSLATMIY